MEYLRISTHAKERFRKRFKKLKQDGEVEHQAAKSRVFGRYGDKAFLLSPCGAVFVVDSGVVTTVLKVSQLSDGLKTALRGNHLCR